MTRAKEVASSEARGSATAVATTAPSIATRLGVGVAAVVGVIYLAVASGGTFQFRQSPYPHHVLVTDGWLHGQLYVRAEVLAERTEAFYRLYRVDVERQLAARGQRLNDALWERIRARVRPEWDHDWSIIDGKRYGYWPPMTSALLLPYVAVFGPQASDMLFSCLVGAATVFAVFVALRQAARVGVIPLDARTCVALTLLFGLGTVHFYLAVTGQVWFLSQVVATLFVALALWSALHADGRWGWAAAAGSALGASFLARTNTVLLAPALALVLFAFWRRHPDRTWGRLVTAVVAFTIPLVVAAAVNFLFNYLRFGDILENGQRMIFAGDPHYRNDYLTYGLFNLHYLPRNFYYYLLNPSLRRYPGTNALTFDPDGNSMFLVTPALLYVFLSGRRRTWFTAALWTGIGASFAMLLLFIATGYSQFGNRYLLEILPLAMLLIAMGMEGRLTSTAVVLVAASVLANAWGMYRFAVEQF